MVASPSSVGPPSLLGITLRRSLAVGRVYLLVGAGISVFYGVVLGLTSGASFRLLFPMLLPVLAVLGSLGAMTVFTTDRVKGVLEYLLAYGVSPRRLFANVLGASVILESVVLVATCGAGVGTYAGGGHPVTLDLVATLGLYSVPMAYASVAFTAVVGIFWTSLSSPRSGVNSPIGLLPIVGITPPLVTMIVALAVGSPGATAPFAVTSTAILLLVAVVVVLVRFVGQLLPAERLLSPT